jgi:hypothetical protein
MIFLALIFFLAKNLRPRLNRLFTWKNNLLFAGGYLALLILLTPISAYLLKDGSFQTNPDKNMITQSPKNWADNLNFYRIPPEGNLETNSEIYKNSSQKFRLTSNTLTIESSSSSEYNQILIERKNINDGEVEVNTYVAPHYAGSIDITKMILPPNISLMDGTMSFQAPSEQILEFKRFNSDFTINQFKRENQNTREMSSSHFGWKAIYLRVPQNLEIISNGTNKVQMVN